MESISIRRTRNCVLFLLAVAAFLGPLSTAEAGRLLTVNTLADTLVSIDTITGKTTPVGPIGFDMHGTDLTMLDNVLYAVTANNDNTFGDPGWTLVSINPQTGAMITNVPLTVSGNRPNVVESVGAVNGKLYVGFSPDGGVSNSTGLVNPVTGAITNRVNYAAIPGVNNFFGSFGVDLDGMSAEYGTGNLLVLDADGSFISIARIDPVNITAQSVRQFNAGSGIEDIVQTAEGIFISGGGSLRRIDPSAPNPIVATIPWNPTGNFNGIAVPEPSTWALTATAAIVLAGACAKRRKFNRTLARSRAQRVT